ncbi:MAG: peptidase [Gammaproteobacteria bacterium]|nr:peptidase [Gammaproteobacteria bacterium]
MTYCLGIKVNDGLVLASDSRTNAGVDYVSVYNKMYRFDNLADRIFVIVTSGNLSISQAVIHQLRRDIEGPPTLTTLASVAHIYDAANYIGQVSQRTQQQYGTGLSQGGINGDAYFIIGGQISGQAPELYLVYAQGNCISPSQENPFLQIGETKYGKPILDRVITPTTTLEDAARAALVSIDSTIRSNITVGPPVELAIIKDQSLQVNHYLKLDENDIFHRSVQQHWNEGVRNAFTTLPRFPWESCASGAAEMIVNDQTAVPQNGPPQTLVTGQLQEVSEQCWSQQFR